MYDIQNLEARQALWDECTRFHGHVCDGLAVGFQAAMLAVDALDLRGQEKVICVSELSGCRLDAVQVVLGCTLGKGNLIYIPRGKSAFSFYNQDSGKSCRIVQKPLPILAHDTLTDFLLAAKAVDLFDIKPVLIDPPKDNDDWQSLPCSNCGELTQEPYLRVRGGALLCLDCLNG